MFRKKNKKCQKPPGPDVHLRCQQKKVGPKKVVAAVFTWSPGAILTSQKGSVTSKIDWQSCDEIKIMQLNFERDLIKTHPQKLGKSAEPFLRLGSRHCFSGVHFFIEIFAIHVVLYIILTQPFNQTSSWTYPFEKKQKKTNEFHKTHLRPKTCGPLLRGPRSAALPRIRIPLGISFTAGVEEQLGRVSGEPPQWVPPQKEQAGMQYVSCFQKAGNICIFSKWHFGFLLLPSCWAFRG